MSRPVTLALLLLAGTLPCQSLTTLFHATNGGAPGGCVFLDLVVTHPGGLHFFALDTNINSTPGTPFQVLLHTTPGSWVGRDRTPSAWTLVASGSGTVQPKDLPSRTDLIDFHLPTGSWGLAIINTQGHAYTDGNLTVRDSHLQVSCGAAANVPFSSLPFQPRTWNGTLFYTASDLPSGYEQGPGCPGPAGLPRLAPRQGSGARQGTLFTLDLTNLPPAGGGVIMFVGYNRQHFGPVILPYHLGPLGAAGCHLRLAPLATFTLVNLGGKASVSLPVPTDPLLTGRSFLCQGMVADPGANPLGLATTGAYEAFMAR